jgi:hypothetical protein
VHIDKGRTLRLIEIEESVLPEGEWLIGISDPEYFGGVGFSMPLPAFQVLESVADSEIPGGILSSDLDASSNLDDPIRTSPVEVEPYDELMPGTYRHGTDPIQASTSTNGEGPTIDYPSDNALILSMEKELEGTNLYAFVPGIFYCSSQQTSVDGVLIEVTQRKISGITIASFRPEDVRTFDVAHALHVEASGRTRQADFKLKSLGSFRMEPFMAATSSSVSGRRGTIELAIALAKNVRLSELKHAYVASKFLESRLVRLLEDVEFFGLAPRNRIYIRNEKHPYGTVVDVRYNGLDGVLNLESETGISCPDEMDTTMQLKRLSFSKQGEVITEVDIEAAVVDMLKVIEDRLEGGIGRNEVLETLFSGEGR